MAVLRIHPRDNVAVALSPVAAGERVRVEGREVTALEDIPQGHKLALAPIAAGGEVIKYGCPIGRAKRDIAPGRGCTAITWAPRWTRTRLRGRR